MRNNKSKVLLGILCLATGMAVILSMLLPGWIWSALTALILIGCGALLFFVKIVLTIKCGVSIDESSNNKITKMDFKYNPKIYEKE
ncbi:hypothetical protein ACK2FO_05575 [Clostridioides difficile]|uniref:hypothetical protein n=1 Tax=Clostridioides difficile TaxID=1496 RepID=UPI0001E88F2E|nr:hypothetical protein Q0Y04_18045 [Clostridioides difficile]